MRMRFFSGSSAFSYSYRSAARPFIFPTLILLLILLLILTFTMRVKPLLIKIAETKADNIAIVAINESVNRRMNEYPEDFQKLVVLEKDQSGNVTALRSNITEINKLKSILSTDITSKLSQISSADVYIPLGSVIGGDLFSGRGPYIPIKLVPVSSVNVDFQDSFTSAGINQTAHEINLKVNANVGVLMPAMKTYVKVSTSIPVSNTILLGRVPNSYTNIVGTTGKAQDNALDLQKSNDNNADAGSGSNANSNPNGKNN